MLFQNRKEAGERLAEELKSYLDHPKTLVMGLARGGVVVAAAVARELHLPLDVIVVRKVGAPDNEELALGAVTETGQGSFNDDLIGMLGVSKEYIKREVERQKTLAQQRSKLYRSHRPGLPIEGQTVILVDDGIATGASAKVAIAHLRAKHPIKIVLAVPVAAPDSLQAISKLVDETHCLFSPSHFQAVGAFYKEFGQVEDEEIISLFQ